MKRCGKPRRPTAAGILILVLLGCLLSAFPALGSGSEGVPKGWEWTDTYRVINFCVLVAVLVLVLRKPVSRSLQGRISGIQDQLADLENRKKEAEMKLAQYNERLSLLDKEARKIVEGYVQQGKDAQQRILQEAKLASEKLEAHARRQIESAFDRARLEVKTAILEEAIVKAEATIRERISAEDQNSLVDDYLNKVVA